MENVRTPLNYTGNKFRLLEQIRPFFPKDIDVMVDLFCGGATVGFNTNCKEVYFIDNNPMVIGLLEFFEKQEFDKLIIKIERLLEEYNLSNSYRNGFEYYKNLINDRNNNNGLKQYNFVGYYRLRDDYNLLVDKGSDKAYVMLYVLLLYGFNNDLRFNAKGDFNLPVGKTDFNKTNVNKLETYLNHIKTIKTHYICAEFDSNNVKNIINKADFVYMDPPYLITTATYNESNKWNENHEKRLLNFLNELIDNKKQFVLSNVLSNNNMRNELLSDWIDDNSENIEVKHLNYSYKSSSYNKKNRKDKDDEIIVVWKDKNENK